MANNLTMQELLEQQEQEFNQVKARDVNMFLGDYCTRYYKHTEKNTLIFENNNRALARKKSSLSTLFKFLFNRSSRSYLC